MQTVTYTNYQKNMESMQKKLGLKKRSVQNGHLKTMLLETESPFFKILRDCRKKSIIQRK